MQDSHALGFAFFAPKNPKPKSQIEYRWQPNTWQLWNKQPYNQVSVMTIGSSDGSTQKSISFTNDTIGNQVIPDSCYNTVQSDKMMEIDTIETTDILNRDRNLSELSKVSMGMGGRIEQLIHQDNNTVDYYHEKRSALLVIYLALPEMFNAIIKKGKRQDPARKDKFIHSGKIGGVQVPLISQKKN